MVFTRRSFGRPGFLAGPFRSTLGRGRMALGQTGLEWYQRAKRAMAQFRDLVARTNRIANKTAREAIFEWIGSPTVDGTISERYAAVEADVLYDVEAYTPYNYNAYQLERRQNRVEDLEGFLEDLQPKVQDAERLYGILPAPETKVVIQPGTTTVVKETDWTAIALAAAGALVVGIALS